ncbi:MAG: AraC family transcriptional regulator [Steroidobacteraceae bacterium]|nr:AraC family transcriptional regulator [Steroidobacteraceae bacterium]
MNPVQKALWFVESHFAQEITLEDLASHAGVSRYHVTRAFSDATGQPLMRYVRGRRLTEAARALANGAPDILAVALEAGYGSHEAFTRAFREQFGVTPESVRARASVQSLQLVEPIRMDQSLLTDLAPPRIVDGSPLHLVGLSERYTCESSAGVPAQWQRFLPYFGHIPKQLGNVAYGVKYNFDEAGNFEYLCGVEVPDFSDVPDNFSRLRVPAQRYAVFAHKRHISEIRRTWATIWARGLGDAGLEAVEGPELERYGEDFDAMRGIGTVDIWIPIRS